MIKVKGQTLKFHYLHSVHPATYLFKVCYILDIATQTSNVNTYKKNSLTYAVSLSLRGSAPRHCTVSTHLPLSRSHPFELEREIRAPFESDCISENIADFSPVLSILLDLNIIFHDIGNLLSYYSSSSSYNVKFG